MAKDPEPPNTDDMTRATPPSDTEKETAKHQPEIALSVEIQDCCYQNTCWQDDESLPARPVGAKLKLYPVVMVSKAGLTIGRVGYGVG